MTLLARQLLERNVDQKGERFLQPSGKFLIHASNLAEQSVCHNPEAPRELGGIKLTHEGAFELGDYFRWQQVHAATVVGRKAVANAG